MVRSLAHCFGNLKGRAVSPPPRPMMMSATFLTKKFALTTQQGLIAHIPGQDKTLSLPLSRAARNLPPALHHGHLHADAVLGGRASRATPRPHCLRRPHRRTHIDIVLRIAFDSPLI